MQGIKLGEMEAGDMLDVVHYLFEEDVAFVSEDHAQAQSGTRTRLYQDLYGTTYKYPYKSKGGANGRTYIDESVIDEPFVKEDLPKPFDPRAQATKPFIPATKLNPNAADPFGGLLDAPIR